MFIDNNELYIPIDNKKIFIDNGVTKGTLYFSNTFESWVVEGHSDVNLIAVTPPFKKGEIFHSENKNALRFKGMRISSLVIKHNHWCLSFNEYFQNNL